VRIAETIAALDADVVALQEVETPARPEPLVLLWRLFEHGYEAVLGHTMRCGPHHYGNLLLSRLPVRSQRLVDLSQPGREPRGLIDTELALDAGPEAPVLRCLATHLGLRAWERRRQIARLSAALDAPSTRDAVPDLSRTLLLGDFNEWRSRSGRLAPLRRRLCAGPSRASFPAAWPLFALDRIWHGSALNLERLEAVRTDSTRAASDHLPIRAWLRLSA
jgi:endonuclease/exonuclease/phosphatase family metal-dependent hydrolase